MSFYTKDLHIKDDNRRDKLVIENVIDNFPDAVHSSDNDGFITYANQKAINLYGYPKSELIGLSIYDLYVNQERTRQGVKKLLNLGNLVVRSKIRKKTGEVIDVVIKSFALFDENGKYTCSFSLLEDITEYANFQRELARSNRLSVIGKFAAGIVHDIRNPLTIIKGVSDILHDEPRYRQDETMQEHTRLLHNAVSKIEQYTSRLLRLPNSRVGETVGEICLVEVVNEAIELVRTKIKAGGIELDSKDMPIDCHIQGRLHQLEQVFVNIISNACDAVHSKQTANANACDAVHSKQTASAPAERERKVSVRIAQDETSVTVSIADTGEGIDAKLRSKVFDPFFSTKGENGFGMGLAISHEIVNLHQGKINIENNHPCGTIFKVYLPKTQYLKKAS